MTDCSLERGHATTLCFTCWGNGMVMHRTRPGIFRRPTFDVLTCPNCNGIGWTTR